MRNTKLTPWEVGNDLAYCYDILSEKRYELAKNGYAEEAEILRECINKIARMFNIMGTHDFGLGIIPKQSTLDKQS